jgi:hypothetical protein
MTAADLDGDGDVDVLASNALFDQVAWYANQVCCELSIDQDALSLAAGGTRAIALDAGPVKALALYWVLTTSSGTSPGLALVPAPLKLPLNWSALLGFTALYPNLLVANSLGFLDGAGQATATLTLPPGLDPGLAGVTLHHAYFVLDSFTLGVSGVSKPVSLKLLP